MRFDTGMIMSTAGIASAHSVWRGSTVVRPGEGVGVERGNGGEGVLEWRVLMS